MSGISEKESEPKDRDSQFESLLFKEYEYLMRSFFASEELGERRVNFFITIAAAALAALVALTETGIPLLGVRIDPLFFLGGSMVLLLFGLITLMRIIHRNIETDMVKRGLDRIREKFVKEHDERIYHLAYNPYSKPSQHEIKKIFSLGTGGLVQMVALMNSVIATVTGIWIVQFIAIVPDLILLISLYGLMSIGTFLVTWAIQMKYVQKRYEKEMQTHLEIRWFFKFKILNSVRNWFEDQLFGPHLTVEKRTDVYLVLPGSEGLGIKVREGKLEIKSRKKASPFVDSTGKIEGMLEAWDKQAWEMSDAMQDITPGLEIGDQRTLIGVEKERRQRWYKVPAKGNLKPLPKSRHRKADCAVELTRLRIFDDEHWWTIALDVFGKAGYVMEKLELAVQWLFQNYVGPKLEINKSYGYPQWLSMVLAQQ